MGRKVVVPERVRRIVSLVPSQTELLYDLGLSAEVVGRTSFCIHPREKVDGARVVGGTKRFRFDVIDELHPDLIIGNKEENYVEGIERLAESHAVWMSDIETLDEALDMIRTVGIWCTARSGPKPWPPRSRCGSALSLRRANAVAWRI